MKQREGHRVIFGKEADELIMKQCCPSCGKHQSEWKRTTTDLDRKHNH